MQSTVPTVAEPAARRSWRARLVSGPVGRRVAIVDLHVYRFLRVQCQVPAAQTSIARFSHLGQHAALWLALGAAGGVVDRERRWRWWRGAAAVGSAYLLNSAIKGVVRRQRPAFAELPALVPTPTALSFPSAHASSSFAAARAYSSLMPAGPLYAVAGAMAVSRVYLGVHYPSDIAAGAALGMVLGAAGRTET
jgi:decaprenylphosphoryl-5-phosphoribose phosphatase